MNVVRVKNKKGNNLAEWLQDGPLTSGVWIT